MPILRSGGLLIRPTSPVATPAQPPMAIKPASGMVLATGPAGPPSTAGLSAAAAAAALANYQLWAALPASGGMSPAQFMAAALTDQWTAYRTGTVSQATLVGLLNAYAPGTAPVTPGQYFLLNPTLVRVGQALGRIPQPLTNDVNQLALLSVTAALNPQASSTAQLQAIQNQNQQAAASSYVTGVMDPKTGVTTPIQKVAFPANPLAGVAASTVDAAANGDPSAAQTILNTVSQARAGNPTSTAMAQALTTAQKLQTIAKYVALYFGTSIAQQVQTGANISVSHATT